MNTYQITRLELSQTKSGKPVVNLFGDSRLEYPILQLFDLSMLAAVCVDPNTLQENKPIYCTFTAHYTESDKLNQKGNPYKDIVKLEANSDQPPATSSQADSLLADILMELKAIRALILTQSHTEPVTAVSQPTVNPQPKTSTATSHPNGRVSQPESDLFQYQYGDGTPVPNEPTIRANFNRYRRAHQEQAPANVAELVSWLKSKSPS